MTQTKMPNTLRRYCYDEMCEARDSALHRLEKAWRKYEETGGDNRDGLDNAVAALVTAHIAVNVEELYRLAEANKRRQKQMESRQPQPRRRALKYSPLNHQLREMTNSSILVRR
jgi:hypothetical protein